MNPDQPAPKRSRLPWILGGLVVLLLLCGGFLAIGALAGGDDNTDTAATPATTTAAAAVKAPAAGDFKLSARITEQTCYGEAGCAVTWLPEVTYSGPAIADGQTWAVSYQVSGLESGTKVGTILISSAGPAKQSVKRGRTAGEDTKITLKVTSVEKG